MPFHPPAQVSLGGFELLGDVFLGRTVGKQLLDIGSVLIQLAFGLGQSLGIWIPAILVAGVGSSVGIACSQAMLQAKVAPDVQGRVFSARRLLTWFPDAFTPILGGLMADRIMEPAMHSGGWLSRWFGWMTGSSPGSGMAVMMVFFGILTILALLSGYVLPSIRNLETILPDHDLAERSA